MSQGLLEKQHRRAGQCHGVSRHPLKEGENILEVAKYSGKQVTSTQFRPVGNVWLKQPPYIVTP